MKQSTDDIETRLRELFQRQASGIETSSAAWDDPPMVRSDALAGRLHSRPRSAFVAAVAVAAAVLVAVAFIGAAPTRDAVRVGGAPGADVPVHFVTQQVRFDASALNIEANGHTFTAGGSEVGVHSDPGTATYQTLELDWHERGVEMRLYFYFAADAHDWWVSSVTTYNGHSEPDWIGYHGPLFRTPLGSAFTGDVDLIADGAPRGAHLHIANMRLQPFLPPAACTAQKQTGAYAIVSNEGTEISLLAEPNTGFDDTVTLYDRATCRPVSTPGKFTYRFRSSARDVVSVEEVGCMSSALPAGYCATHTYVSLTAKAPGKATMHVDAVDVRTNAVVAQLDVPLTAKR